MRRSILLVCIVIATILLSISTSFGQQLISLGDVKKLTLRTHEGGMGAGTRLLEVVQVDDQWKCYQTRFIDYDIHAHLINDSARTFVKNVPAQIIQQLLDIIARKDTGVHPELFNISKDKLVSFIDSLKADLKPAQRAELIDSLNSERIIKEALNIVVHPLLKDDATYYGITILTEHNVSFTIHAESFASLYDFPWHIGNAENFDPNIALIFASISGFDGYSAYEFNDLHHRLVRQIYFKYFQTKFNWDNFKADQPVMNSMLGNTIMPVTFYKDNERSFVTVRSSLLPKYVQIRFGFGPNETTAITEVKRYEKFLSGIFKNKNFLFDYLRDHPGYVIELLPGRMEDIGPNLFKDIKKYYKAIDKFDYRQSLAINIHKGREQISKWVWLPNNSLVLVELRLKSKDEFMNDRLKLSDEYSFPHPRMVCFVFDASGKITEDYNSANIRDF